MPGVLGRQLPQSNVAAVAVPDALAPAAQEAFGAVRHWTQRSSVITARSSSFDSDFRSILP